MRKSVLIFAIFISYISIVSGQGLGSPGTIKDDGRFAASTKQMNQFFRRFNGEESIDGTKRFYLGDSLYQNEKLSFGIDFRSNNIESFKNLEKNSLDFYASMKSLYSQDRENKIKNNQRARIEVIYKEEDWEEIDNQ